MSSPKKSDLTARDLEYLVVALQNLKGNAKLEIDYEKMAAVTGLKNANTACAVWTPIKNKLFDRDRPSAKKATSKGSSSPAGVKKRASKKQGGKKAQAEENANGSTKVVEDQQEGQLGDDMGQVEDKVESKTQADTPV